MPTTIMCKLFYTITYFLVAVTIVNGNQCQWNSPEGCKRCRHNLYLHNGTCVSACPEGFVEQRPLWVFSWKREIGRTCQLKSDGSVKAWGSSRHGGSDPELTSGVVTIFSKYKAFAALKSDGSVKAWG